MLRILGISGCLRQGSHNTSLLRAAAKLLPPGVELEVFDGLRDVPPYDTDADVEPADAVVARLRDAVGAADGVLIATPEYNGSIPGVLNNALDWASRPFPQPCTARQAGRRDRRLDRTVGAVWAQTETRKVLGIIGADVIDEELPVGEAECAFADNGQLVEPHQHAVLADLVHVLTARAGAEERQAA